MSPLPSSRFPASLEPNPLTLAVRRARATGRPLLDLTLTNPTRAGFAYPLDLLQSSSSREALRYEPEPLGLPAARRAIAADYFRRGTHAHPDRIVLTASTSEAYPGASNCSVVLSATRCLCLRRATRCSIT